MFPSNGSLKRRPLPSAGSIGPVPPPRRYYEALRLPAARFAALRCLHLAIPPVRPVCSQRPGRTTVGSGELLFRVPSRKLSVETAGSLRFPSDPRVPTPCSQTPAGPIHAGYSGVSARPPLRVTTVAPAISAISGLNRTALGLAVYASQGGLPLRRARLASGCWPSSAGRDSFTRRVAMKGFRVSSLFLLSRACLTLHSLALRAGAARAQPERKLL